MPWIALSLVILLSSCVRLPEAYPDFCKEQNRKIPEHERIENALKFTFENKAYIRNNNEHFIKFVENEIKRQKNSDIGIVTKIYLSKYPNCCFLETAYPIKDAKYVFKYFPHEPEVRWAIEFDEGFRWVYDIHISIHDPNIYSINHKYLNFHDMKFPKYFNTVISDDCGRSNYLIEG